MTQEDINELLTGLTNQTQQAPLKKCPECGEPYFGNGILPCLDCSAPRHDDGGVR